MHFRKLITIWALLALMLGQITLVQHSATHIDHGVSFELVSSHSDHHDHQEEDQKHKCPECLLTKSLQTAFYNTPVVLSFVLQSEAVVLQPSLSVEFSSHYNANSPRAPPVNLI